MINIFSSIPLAHANGIEYIQECVKSWQVHGTVYSINHPDEIIKIKELFPDVEFIPTYQTQIGLVGKPLVTIDCIFNEMRFRHNGKSLFINSDCSLTQDKELLLSQFQEGRFTYLHRWNYDNTEEVSFHYINGVDAFLFTTVSVLDSIPATHFCVGQTYFDLYYPYSIAMAGMEVCTSTKKIVFHKNHKEQYKPEDWILFGNYCGLLISKRMEKPAQITEFLYKFLRTLTVKI